MPFEFPPEPKDNKLILKPFDGECKLWWGTDKWGRTEWVGTLYPPSTREQDLLEHYSNHFNAVELNATHYKVDRDSLTKWVKKVEGKNFIFCPKMPQRITHYSRFEDVDGMTREFYDAMTQFSNHLGPIYMRISDKMSFNRRELVWEFLEKNLPRNNSIFLQVNNPDWFTEAAYSVLVEKAKLYQVGMVIEDAVDVEFKLKLDLTIPKCYIRFKQTGNRDRLRQWIIKLKEWKQAGLQEAYFFIHAEKGTDTVADLEYFRTLVADF